MKHSRNLPELDRFETYRPSAQALAARANHEDAPEENLTRRQRMVSWICALVAAGIMIETLFFKFTAAPESVYIFSKMGTDPWMRWIQGLWELSASLCLLLPGLKWAGGMLATGAMAAAIISHLTWLGISVQGDHGLLFCMALVTFGGSAVVLYLHRDSIPFVTAPPTW